MREKLQTQRQFDTNISSLWHIIDFVGTPLFLNHISYVFINIFIINMQIG